MYARSTVALVYGGEKLLMRYVQQLFHGDAIFHLYLITGGTAYLVIRRPAVVVPCFLSCQGLWCHL